MRFIWGFRLGWLVMMAAATTTLSGCGQSGPKTHRVSGKLVVQNGDINQFKGHQIEATLVDNPEVKASGMIEADGSFTLETLDKGTLYSGAREGKYQARIVLVDEGDGQTKKPKVPRSYLQNKTSGWSVQVPAQGEVTLTLASK